MKIIRSHEFQEGRWRNGMGVSWDIASEASDEDGFGWRFAIARIDADVPFSVYPGVDRVFTLFEGGGLDLDFDVEGNPTLSLGRLYVPYPYPCDVPARCRLRAGPCHALNLFTRRGMWTAAADVLSRGVEITHEGLILLFALEGAANADGLALAQGDAAVTRGSVRTDTEGFLFAARLAMTQRE